MPYVFVTGVYYKVFDGGAEKVVFLSGAQLRYLF